MAMVTLRSYCLPRLRRITLRLCELWGEYSESADPSNELENVLSRLPQLEELSIDMHYPSGTCSTEMGPRLRITSQSLRLLDLRGMSKACEVGYLACPALEEMRTLWRCWYGGGILPLEREGDGCWSCRCLVSLETLARSADSCGEAPSACPSLRSPTGA
jgi:hypothetical protein